METRVIGNNQLRGTIDRVVGNGFTLEGRSGFLNLSRYAPPGVQIPIPGTPVVVTLDPRGYVRSIVEDEEEPGQPQPEIPTASLVPPGRERCITRMACLNTATNIVSGSCGGAKLDEVLEVASTLEAWVLRGVDA